MRKIVLLAAAVVFFAGIAGADEVVQAQHSDADYNAVYELFDTMEMERNIDDNITMMIDLQVRNMPPQMAGMRQVLEDFFRKYLAYDQLKQELADTYLAIFTVDEIRALNDFYRTPLGRKVTKNQAAMTQAQAQIGERRVNAHVSELQAAIAAKMATQQ